MGALHIVIIVWSHLHFISYCSNLSGWSTGCLQFFHLFGETDRLHKLGVLLPPLCWFLLFRIVVTSGLHLLLLINELRHHLRSNWVLLGFLFLLIFTLFLEHDLIVSRPSDYLVFRVNGAAHVARHTWVSHTLKLAPSLLLVICA